MKKKLVFKAEMDFFPPSKNKLYYGSAVKKAFNRSLEASIPKVKEFKEYVKNSQKEYIVIFKFYLSDENYRRFEGQNFLEVLYDALFTEYHDHKIKASCFSKERGNNKIHIEIYELD